MLGANNLGAILLYSCFAICESLFVLDIDKSDAFRAFLGERYCYGISQTSSTSSDERYARSNWTSANRGHSCYWLSIGVMLMHAAMLEPVRIDVAVNTEKDC